MAKLGLNPSGPNLHLSNRPLFVARHNLVANKQKPQSGGLLVRTRNLVGSRGQGWFLSRGKWPGQRGVTCRGREWPRQSQRELALGYKHNQRIIAPSGRKVLESSLGKLWPRTRECFMQSTGPFHNLLISKTYKPVLLPLFPGGPVKYSDQVSQPVGDPVLLCPCPKATRCWVSLPRCTVLPVCGYLGAGALVGFGVCVPRVKVPGRK